MTNCNDYKTGLYNINTTTQSSEEVIKGTVIVPKDELPDDVKTECLIEGSRRENENEPEKIGSETKNDCTSQIDGIVNSFSIETDLFDTRTDIMQKYQLYNYYQDVKKTTSDTYETVCQVETTDNCCIKFDHSETEKVKGELRQEVGDIISESTGEIIKETTNEFESAIFGCNYGFYDENGVSLSEEGVYVEKSINDFETFNSYFIPQSDGFYERTNKNTDENFLHTIILSNNLKDDYEISYWGIKNNDNTVDEINRVLPNIKIDLLGYSGNDIAVVCKQQLTDIYLNMPEIANAFGMTVNKSNGGNTALSDDDKTYAIVDNENIPFISWLVPNKTNDFNGNYYYSSSKKSYWLCFMLLRDYPSRNIEKTENWSKYFLETTKNGFNNDDNKIFPKYDKFVYDENEKVYTSLKNGDEINCCYFKITTDYKDMGFDVMWHFHCNNAFFTDKLDTSTDETYNVNYYNGAVLYLYRTDDNRRYTKDKDYNNKVEVIQNYSSRNAPPVLTPSGIYNYDGLSSIVKIYNIDENGEIIKNGRKYTEVDYTSTNKYYLLKIVNTSICNDNRIVVRDKEDVTSEFVNQRGLCDFLMEAIEVEETEVPNKSKDTPKVILRQKGSQKKIICNISIYKNSTKEKIDFIEKEIDYETFKKYYKFDEINNIVEYRVKEDIENVDKSNLLWKSAKLETNHDYVIESNIDCYNNQNYKEKSKINITNGIDIMKYSNVKIYDMSL